MVCLLLGMLPSGAVLAESNEKAMQLGTEALNTNVNTTNSAIVYYGLDNAGNPYAYRVIGYGKDNGVKTSVSTDSTATLLALSRYGSSAFSTQSSNAYSSSNLKA